MVILYLLQSDHIRIQVTNHFSNMSQFLFEYGLRPMVLLGDILFVFQP